MIKKVFKPFTWLIIFAVINFIAAGIGSFFDAEGVAKSGWGEGNILGHDVYAFAKKNARASQGTEKPQ